MKINRIVASVALGFGLAGFVPADARTETLKIGIIAPLTGAGAASGMAVSEGAKIAAADMNAKGGLEVGGKKYQVQIIVYDDQYKAADSVAAYNRLVNQDGAKFMLVYTSAAAVALRQQVEDDKVVALTGAYSAKAIDAKTVHMFRIWSTATDYVPPFSKWLRDNVKGHRMVIMNPNDETGWYQNEFTTKIYKEAGFDVLSSELFERTEKNFAPMFTKIIAMNPDVIELGTASPGSAALMVRQARELGYKGVFAKTGAPSNNEIITGAGKEAAEGAISVIFADPANPGFRRIAAEYKKDTGQEANEILAPCYDSINVLMRAIQVAGDVTNGDKVAAAFSRALPTTSVQGDQLILGGKATSGADQQIMSVSYVTVIHDGVPVVKGKLQ